MSISIHAPLAGCDLNQPEHHPRYHKFQSTHPLRGATAGHTLPRNCGRISIHAPLAGCDRHRRSADQARRGFQSTHPLRGATSISAMEPGAGIISIHAPLAGCDPLGRDHGVALAAFQSTHPLRGATRPARCGNRRRPGFQSTHPLRGATRRQIAPGRPRSISIHAPLAGCDVAPAAQFHGLIRFQSTHPLRGATLPKLITVATNINFNPRTPCGVRPIICITHTRKGVFQSTHPLRGATCGRPV